MSTTEGDLTTNRPSPAQAWPPGTNGDPRDTTHKMNNEQLAEQICSYATRIAAATCTFLLAIAEYDRREAWQDWECRSMTDWLSWRCGITPATAAQHCRTAAALLSLPLVRQAFAAGKLSYSQVRAITRVATADTEEALVDLARYMTAAQLERLSATYQRCRAAAEQTSEERDLRRTLSWTYDDDGSVIGTFRLAPEEGAVLIKAISEYQHRFDSQDETTTRAINPVGALRADALVEIAGTALQARQNASPTDPGDRYLVTIITEEAAVANLATNPVTMDAPDMAPDSTRVSVADRFTITDESDPRTLECHVAGGAGLAPSTLERLLCDQPTVRITVDHDGNPLDVGRRTRRINRTLRRALQQRDGRCRYPGCTAVRTDAHHIQHWNQGGHTRLDNLISLCSRHHHRHHQGGFTITTIDDGTYVFTLANGTKITDRAPDSESRSPDSSSREHREPRSPWSFAMLDTPAEPFACSSDWDGSHPDYGYITSILADIEYPPTIPPQPDSATDAEAAAVDDLLRV